jgi:F0F1-type ATP synthase delta subunit
MNNSKIAKEIADGVIEYLNKKGKITLLSEVIKNLKETEFSKDAFIFSPIALNQKETEKAKKLVYKLSNEQPGKVNVIVDESLIDGLKIVYKDNQWDFSVAGEISSLI